MTVIDDTICGVSLGGKELKLWDALCLESLAAFIPAVDMHVHKPLPRGHELPKVAHGHRKSPCDHECSTATV